MTDWLARKRRGVIDFSLPGDPHHLPGDVSYARIREYYEQIRRHGEPPAQNPPDASAPNPPPPQETEAPPPASPAPAVPDRPTASQAVPAAPPRPGQSPTQGRLI